MALRTPGVRANMPGNRTRVSGRTMIRGYVEQSSPRAGDVATLRVATDAPEFRVEVYRWGATMALQDRSEWFEGRDAPPHLPFHDWGRANTGLRGEPLEPWPSCPLPVGAGWRSGVYVAVLVEGDGSGRDRTDPDRSTPDGREAKALFVVRSRTPTAAILVKLPLLTYHAYNLAGGEPYDAATASGQWCFYNVPRAREVPIPFPPGLGLHRPGGGTGATPYDVFNTDPFDPTPRQAYIHFNARFDAWLERAGYDVEYCTDVDLHRDGEALLAPHRLLVSVGHDEYYSDAMRSAVEAYVDGGGNVAWFSGNTCWWRVAFGDDVTFTRLHFWHEPDRPGEPENSLVGVSFRNGGERDRDDFPVPVGYRVQDAGHWVYAGTGLSDGDTFGAGADEYLLGYECDGAAFDRADLDAGRAVEPTGEDGTPKDFAILAVGDCRPSGWGFGNAAATMGLLTRGRQAGRHTGRHTGTVFTASTTDWARVLTGGTPAAHVLDRITRNVLDRLGAAGAMSRP
jgi:hypothetical protein